MSAELADALIAAKSNPTTVTDSPVTDPGSTAKASQSMINFKTLFALSLKLCLLVVFLD